MPLNLQASGDFTPFVKFNAKAGRFYARLEGQMDEAELQLPMQIAFDFPAIKTGWIKFGENGPPHRKWDPSLSVEALCPDPKDDKYKRGFQVNVYITTHRLGLRELMSTASAIIGPIMALYEQWEQHGNSAEVPVVRCSGVETIKSNFGVSYSPIFEFEKWAPRAKVPGFDVIPTPRSGEVGAPLPKDEDEPYVDDDIPF